MDRPCIEQGKNVFEVLLSEWRSKFVNEGCRIPVVVIK